MHGILAIYIGPLKINVELDIYEIYIRMICQDTDQVVGYLKDSWDHTSLSYNIDHIEPHAQALIRSANGWDAAIHFTSGEVWSGPVTYNVEKNSLQAEIVKTDES